MRTLNHLFSSAQRLESFIDKNNVDKKEEHFIQVFIGDNNPQRLEEISQVLQNVLPSCIILSTSTAGEIVEGGMTDNTIVISISTFENTKVRVELFEGSSEEEIAQEVASTMLSQNTKLLLAFNNVYSNDGEDFLESLQRRAPHITVAGGNAGDNGSFSHQTLVGTNDKVSTTAIAIATFDSDCLQVFHEYLFNWQTLGESMLVTKADKSTIYEINDKKAQDIYREFLGNGVADSLPGSGVEFPLIFNEDDIDIARAPVAIGENGSLIMAGHIKEGTTVKFGFGDVSQNDKSVVKTLQDFSNNPIESIFIYSCSARKYFLKEHLNNEFEMLQQIAPTSGFVTYGEFFKQQSYNKMLNVSSTFIGLSENSNIKHNINFQEKEKTPSLRTLDALTNLVKVTSSRIDEKNHRLNQLQHLIKEATLYSATDLRGIITEVNDKFVELSGYSKEELIGRQHNIVRHEEMPSEVYKDMWTTIKDKKSWMGIVKNKAKDGSAYYVRSHIFPLLDTHNNIVEYVSIRDDITEEMNRKANLEGTLSTLEEQTKDKEYLLNQYEKIIDYSSAFIRLDFDFNILHANDVFCNLYGCSHEEMQETNISDILEKDFFETQFMATSETFIREGKWSGVVPFQCKDKAVLYMNTSAYIIYDKNGSFLEIMIVLHDISDLITAQKEIVDTQRDVIYTMGSIGETRSKETGNHVKRVAEYSKILALEYGLDEDEAELLKMASPMHDIGKVGIPDAILNKPGKLTDDEWKIMKTHSALGYTMLKNSKRDILKTAAVVAYTHHEKWDGSGYPKATKGKDIHIYGRITAIADVFDALGSDRCYKKAWNDEDIFDLLKDGAGKHFDPDLINIFFKKLDTFLEIRSKFKD